MNGRRRLSYEDRKTLEDLLDGAAPLWLIAERLGFDATTISREILRNRIEMVPVKKCKVKPITCERFASCKVGGICSPRCPKRCRSCNWKRCEEICPEFKAITCKIPQGYPHTCNSCVTKNRCLEQRFIYRAKAAQTATEVRLCESRSGIDLSGAELAYISDIVTPLIKRGQSVSTILKNHPEIALSPSTLYRYLARGVLDARYIDLPRAVRIKKRKKKDAGKRYGKHTDDGRSYDDFMALNDATRSSATEMDTVIGKVGGKCLLTFCSRQGELFYALLLPNKTSACVVEGLDLLERNLVKACILMEVAWPILLTDNGTEFSDFEGIETSCNHPEKRCDLYFCNPYSSWEKPHVENAHTLLRRVLPKKTSFDELTQGDIDLICSHINSYRRQSLDWRSPFETLPAWGQENIPGALGMRIIPPDDINLTPGLLY